MTLRIPQRQIFSQSRQRGPASTAELNLSSPAQRFTETAGLKFILFRFEYNEIIFDKNELVWNIQGHLPGKVHRHTLFIFCGDFSKT